MMNFFRVAQILWNLLNTIIIYQSQMFFELNDADADPSKIGQNFACFQKKVKGFTLMVNLPTCKLKTGALCVAFARVKIHHFRLPTG